MTDELQDRLRSKPTGELVAILRAQDGTAWRPEVFPLVETILQERGADTRAVDGSSRAAQQEMMLTKPAMATMARSSQLNAELGAFEHDSEA